MKGVYHKFFSLSCTRGALAPSFLAPEAYSLASQERWCGAGCPDAVYEVMSNYGIVDPASQER